ncbi:hypothetical protein X767_11545 [Mesorhizobium sp. LSJC264A00]|nr:hypothetical protein X767_11545 [Mesorhizobium sp. LSJC264A00]
MFVSTGRCARTVSSVSADRRICAKPPPKQPKDDTSERTDGGPGDREHLCLAKADNAEIDAHIATLKAALAREGTKQAVFDPTKLAHSNREGRKLMQAYFRQRGVTVSFSG